MGTQPTKITSKWALSYLLETHLLSADKRCKWVDGGHLASQKYLKITSQNCQNYPKNEVACFFVNINPVVSSGKKCKWGRIEGGNLRTVLTLCCRCILSLSNTKHNIFNGLELMFGLAVKDGGLHFPANDDKPAKPWTGPQHWKVSYLSDSVC